MKIVIVIALLAVVGALGGAGVFMLRRPKNPESSGQTDKRMARALAVRVGVSVALFLFVLLSWKLGWISPHGVPTGG